MAIVVSPAWTMEGHDFSATRVHVPDALAPEVCFYRNSVVLDQGLVSAPVRIRASLQRCRSALLPSTPLGAADGTQHQRSSVPSVSAVVKIYSPILLPDAESAEDQVQNVVIRRRPRNLIERPQRVVEIHQKHLMWNLVSDCRLSRRERNQ